jgi:hypothetical protein
MEAILIDQDEVRIEDGYADRYGEAVQYKCDKEPPNLLKKTIDRDRDERIEEDEMIEERYLEEGSMFNSQFPSRRCNQLLRI